MSRRRLNASQLRRYRRLNCLIVSRRTSQQRHLIQSIINISAHIWQPAQPPRIMVDTSSCRPKGILGGIGHCRRRCRYCHRRFGKTMASRSPSRYCHRRRRFRKTMASRTPSSRLRSSLEANPAAMSCWACQNGTLRSQSNLQLQRGTRATIHPRASRRAASRRCFHSCSSARRTR